MEAVCAGDVSPSRRQDEANADPMTWNQGDSIFVHIQGEAATCPPPATSTSGSQTPLYVGSYLGAMQTEGSLPVLTVPRGELKV